VIALLANPAVTAPQLSVIGGLHAGVTLALDGPGYRIGTDVDSDILLADSGVLPGHAMLRFKGRGIAVEAVAGDVQVGERTVARGTGYRCPLPVQLQIGQALLQISAPQPLAAPLPPTLLWAQRHLPLLAMAAVTLTVGLYSAMSVSQSAPQPQVNLAALEAPVPPPASEQDVAQALRQQLSEARLPMLSVTAEDNYLRVSGELDADQRARWGSVQQWFDSHYGHDYLLHNAVTLRAPMAQPRVRIQGVWLGDKPYVVGERGERLYPGAAMAEGWVLQRIEPEQLVLSRNGNEFKLSL